MIHWGGPGKVYSNSVMIRFLVTMYSYFTITVWAFQSYFLQLFRSTLSFFFKFFQTLLYFHVLDEGRDRKFFNIPRFMMISSSIFCHIFCPTRQLLNFDGGGGVYISWHLDTCPLLLEGGGLHHQKMRKSYAGTKCADFTYNVEKIS